MRPAFLLPLLAPTAAVAEKVTYDDHVFPIFQQACLNCHNPDKAKGGLDLSTFGGAMRGGSGGKIVEPGDPASKLVALVKQSAEPKMPPEGDAISADAIAVLESWIEGGLLENASSTARKPSKPKFETALRSDPAAKPDGPPPMPEHVLLDPPVVTDRASAVPALAASPWAPLLAVAGQRQVLLHQTESLELVGVLPFPEGDPVSLSFTPDARYLVVGGGVHGKSGVTVTFDVVTGERTLVAGREFDAVMAGDLRPGFDLVATGGPSRLLKLWDTSTGELAKSVKKHTDWITALDISPDGVLLASGDRNGGAWVWEATTANEFHTLRGHEAAITATVFRGDSNVLATASEDGSVRYWEMNGGAEIRKNDAHPGGVTALAFSRDGRSLTAGRDRKVKLWKADLNHERDLAQDLPVLPTAVALDAEGERAFVADAMGTVRVFSTADGASLGEFQANPPSIEARLVALSASLEELTVDLSTKERSATEAQQSLEAARKALAEAEARLGQAREIAAAAKRGAEEGRQQLEALRRVLSAKREEVSAAADQPDRLAKLEDEHAGLARQEQEQSAVVEGAVQAAAAAEERVKSATDAVPAARDSLAAAEQRATESAGPVAALREEISSQEAKRKHWIAASINTRALAARRAASEHELDRESLLEAQAAAIAALDGPIAALREKQAEREWLAEHFVGATASSEVEAEKRATLAALDRRIEQLAEHLAAAEAEALAARTAAERGIVEAFHSSNEAATLREAYETAAR